MRRHTLRRAAWLLAVGLGLVASATTASAENIDPYDDGSQYAWSENAGWLNAQPLGAGGPGVDVGDADLIGYVWAENVGWVSLSCANAPSCGSVDYGVDNDGLGNLSGYGWSENAGWINFGPSGAGVRIDAEGIFRGDAWAENLGWIRFRSSGAVPYQVQSAWLGAIGIPSLPVWGAILLASLLVARAVAARRRRAAMLAASALVALLVAPGASAGELEPPPAGPSDPASAMHTLDDVYNRLTDNTTADPRSGPFQEPAAAPGATGHALDEVYELAIPTRVPKTGQIASQRSGDDGDLEPGVAWPNPRFTDNGDGTVTDNLTRLIWLKNAGRCGAVHWPDALSCCNGLADDGVELTDGSSPGDWRLPSIRELHSLIHYGFAGYSVPNTAGTGQYAPGDPFDGVPIYAWSSSTLPTGTPWRVYFLQGKVEPSTGDVLLGAWPVRGGN